MLRVREHAAGLGLAPGSLVSYWYYLVLLCITPLLRIAKRGDADKAEKEKAATETLRQRLCDGVSAKEMSGGKRDGRRRPRQQNAVNMPIDGASAHRNQSAGRIDKR